MSGAPAGEREPERSAQSLLGAVAEERKKIAERIQQKATAKVPDPASVPDPERPAVVAADGSWDWSRSYDYFDKFEAAEAKREELQRQQEERERAKQMPAPEFCNHDRSAERRLFEMMPETQLEEIRLHKLLGDSYLAEGQFVRASMAYEKALVVFVYAFPEGDMEREFRHLELACHLNAAQAALKATDWESALQHCAQAERLDPANPKLHYRRAIARRARDELNEALADLLRAQELAPKDANIRRELRMVQGALRAYKARSRAIAKRVLGPGASSATADPRAGAAEAAREASGVAAHATGDETQGAAIATQLVAGAGAGSEREGLAAAQEEERRWREAQTEHAGDLLGRSTVALAGLD